MYHHCDTRQDRREERQLRRDLNKQNKLHRKAENLHKKASYHASVGHLNRAARIEAKANRKDTMSNAAGVSAGIRASNIAVRHSPPGGTLIPVGGAVFAEEAVGPSMSRQLNPGVNCYYPQMWNGPPSSGVMAQPPSAAYPQPYQFPQGPSGQYPVQSSADQCPTQRPGYDCPNKEFPIPNASLSGPSHYAEPPPPYTP